MFDLVRKVMMALLVKEQDLYQMVPNVPLVSTVTGG
jgi:hypothetical protein